MPLFLVVLLILVGLSLFAAVRGQFDMGVIGQNDGSFSEAAIDVIARAIANAEGFNKSGSLSQRTNNPGDLELGNVGGGTVGGKTVYPDVTTGMAALRNQVLLMVTGQSRHYNPDMSIREIAKKYTGGDQSDAWAENVASELGISADQTFNDFLWG